MNNLPASFAFDLVDKQKRSVQAPKSFSVKQEHTIDPRLLCILRSDHTKYTHNQAKLGLILETKSNKLAPCVRAAQCCVR